MYKKIGTLFLSTCILTTLLPVNEVNAKQGKSNSHQFNQLVKKEKANGHKLVKQKKDARNALKELPKSEEVSINYKDYVVDNVEKDELNYTHYTLYPEIKGKKAKDKEVKVHVNAQGKVVSINGDTDAKKVKPTNKVEISKNQAINTAFNNLKIPKKKANNLDRKVIKKAESEVDGKRNKYIYNIELVTVKPEVGHWAIKIDAQSGKVLEKINLANEAATTGTGKGVLGDQKKININSIAGGYSLEDLTHQGKISAYNFNNSTGNASLITNNTKSFDKKNQNSGVDANYYAAEVYNYYKNTHNRESYDDKGSPINSLTHVDVYGGHSNMNNAAWVGDKMIYNDGDGHTFTGLSGAKDVVAHEITHGVTQNTANLRYYGQSGALNESFSDVFGYFVDNDDWLMGEDVYTPGKEGDALRSMKDPKLYNQPEHMNSYVYTSRDNAGVHTNSGIPNKAAYNTISKIGQVKAEKIYYRALTQYLTSNSQFKDAKYALSQSALDLYDLQTAKEVWNAWNSVGVQ